jgi:tripartite-type tricarboxylate transporter receptor subunit TctC
MKALWKSGIAGLCLAFLIGLATTVVTQHSAEAAWEPKKPVKFVIMAGKGGGADPLARFIQGIIEKHSLSAVSRG